MPTLPVIDLHSHVVPGVDDGARSFEEAGKMLDAMEHSCSNGSVVILTPHYSVNMPEKVVEARKSRVSVFMNSVSEQYSLELMAAGELLVRGFSLKNLDSARYPGTGWVLVEFPFRVTWLETLYLVRSIIKKGFSPVIAHPERYRWCRKHHGRLVSLSRMGCGVLVSARSLRSQKYAPTARRLLAQGLTHGLASDAHSSDDYILDHRLKALVTATSRISWERLTCENPGKILEDEKLPELPLQKRIAL